MKLPRLEIGHSLTEAPAISLSDVVTGAAPRQATTFRIARTAEALQIQFNARDLDAWGTLTQRDDPLYREEVVEVFLDTAGDLGAYIEIEVSPLNTVLDLMIRRNRAGLRKDFRWQCENLRTSVIKDAAGWVADFTIPFADIMSEPPAPGACWRANFTRIDRPPGQPRELSAWSPTGLELFHVPERFGYLDFR